MSVNYNLAVLTNRLQQVANALDAGPSNGFMRLLDNGSGVLISFQLARPCANPANGVMNFNGLSLVDPAAAGSGVATMARFEDSAGTIVISGLTVGAASPGASYDIFMTPSNQITAGQTAALTAATIAGH